MPKTPRTTSRPTPKPRTGGRIRSEDAAQDVMRAACELLEETSYRQVTIDGVAARSGVAKSTIYRWWKSKGDLVIEAYERRIARRMPEPDTGSLDGDLTAFVEALYGVVAHPLRSKTLRGLMAEAQLDDEFAAKFRILVQARRAALRVLLQRSIERGELSPKVDLEYAIDSVFGPFWYRLLVGHVKLDPREARSHVHQLLAGLARKSRA